MTTPDVNLRTGAINTSAVVAAKIAANAVTTAKIAANAVTEAKLEAGAAGAGITGAALKFAADANVIGAVPVLHRIAVDGGAAENVDVVLTHKTRIIDARAVHTGGAGDTSDTIQVKNGTSAITNAMDWSGADKALVRAAEIDDAAHEIAAGGTLRIATVDGDGGDNVGAGIVYVLGLRVA